MTGKIVIFKRNESFCFEMKSRNGHVLAYSKEYKTRDSCLKVAISFLRNAQKASVYDPTQNAECPCHPKFLISTTEDGKYIFRLTALNGNVIACSMPYFTKICMLDAIKTVKRNLELCYIEENGKILPVYIP